MPSQGPNAMAAAKTKAGLDDDDHWLLGTFLDRWTALKDGRAAAEQLLEAHQPFAKGE
jgi:hypothetical protein